MSLHKNMPEPPFLSNKDSEWHDSISLIVFLILGKENLRDRFFVWQMVCLILKSHNVKYGFPSLSGK